MENSSPTPTNVAYFSDGNVLRDMGRAEGRLDGHDRELKEIKDSLKALSDSVAKLKEWKAFIIGGSVVIGSVASLVTTLITKFLPL
jgi:hypothetical protein